MDTKHSDVSVVDNTSSNSNVSMYGVYTSCRHTNTSNVGNSYNYYAYSDDYNKAVNKHGIYTYMAGSSSTNAYGGFFYTAITGSNNYGIKAYAGGGSNMNYAVHATTTASGCTNGSSCTNAAGYFDGDVFVTNGTYLTSDAMFKTNIQSVNNAKNLLNSCNVKSFNYNSGAFGNINLPQGNHFGLIAQDVELILPNFVKTAIAPEVFDSINNITYPEFSYKAVNYTEFIPILIQGFKEQQQTIDSLIQVISLQNPTPQPNINPQNSQKISLSNVSSIILNQNDPNPFTESTRITFQIPDEVKDARIIFTSLTGSIINTAIINERGAGELEVYSSELSKGLYNYTLVCDGKVIASKKMVKQ
ncbi:MAG: tail fiber domain-containing protein [Bacteroidetes bacterium]|nr:tail fiber domain-containing protein [Bacteroidota bacterium]